MLFFFRTDTDLCWTMGVKDGGGGVGVEPPNINSLTNNLPILLLMYLDIRLSKEMPHDLRVQI